jgi:hypothetical protein
MKEIIRMNSKTILNVLASISFSCYIAGCHSNRAEFLTNGSLSEIKSPAAKESFSPRVVARSDGSVILSWLEPQGDSAAALRFSVWRNEAWSEPTTIAAAQPFSRHPSESPGVISLSDKNLIAYWSQKPAREKIPAQEVDVYFSVSTDRGAHWTSPTLASHPGTGEESSYPSAAPVDEKHAALIWLDGANWTKQKRVALMSRTVHSDGSATEATVIDPDTCTCCPTSLVRAGSGLVAAYRGHTPENVRDISLLRNVDGRWSQPHVAHADNWHFAGCPVNGPHLDADRKRTVIAWFTGAQDQPAVNLAFSIDGGANFSGPIRVDEGNAIGRAQAVLLAGHSAVAFWLERVSGTTRLLARTVHDDGMMETPIEISRGSDLGYPHAARAADAFLITWAEGDPVRRVHVALFSFAGHEEVQ